jgi:hypothetical protein
MRCTCGGDGKFKCTGEGIVDYLVVFKLGAQHGVPVVCKEEVETVVIDTGMYIVKTLKDKNNGGKEVRVIEVYL